MRRVRFLVALAADPPREMTMYLIKQFLFLLSVIRLLPHYFAISASNNKDLMYDDIKAWAKCLNDDEVCDQNVSPRRQFFQLMTYCPPFRNVFYIRCKRGTFFLQILCRQMHTLEIFIAQCGGGLFIQHGYATTISAEAIGINCWINQNVSIGYANHDSGRPTIGDNVRILAGAKILGGVKIGDNSVIGANSVVLADVPADVSVMGVPAKIVWRKMS